MPRSERPRWIAVLALAVLTVLTTACTSSPAPTSPAAAPVPPLDPRATPIPVSTDRAMPHLQALERIADANGGNRASGTPGYEASVDYAAGVLRKAGLEVATPAFDLRAKDREDGGPDARPRNVIARTKGGDPAHVVVVGAHLDSVHQGPGIVDDGSGVAAVLEIATRLAALPPGGNQVVFGLFGAEEIGGVGSTAFVEGLSSADRDRIMLFLNVDMIASPNGGYLIQGGYGDGKEETGPEKSGDVAQVLIDALARTGVTAGRIPFVGDDEVAFIEAGIPSAGAENGDKKTKPAEEAKAWGGQAGAVYDPCYHQACDRVSNVNREVFDHYLRAVADTVAHYRVPQNSISR